MNIYGLISWWFHRCRITITISLLILVFGIIVGLMFWPMFRGFEEDLVKKFSGLKPFTLEMFCSILINNLTILYLWITVGGITLILPYVVLLVNAIILGSFAGLIHFEHGISPQLIAMLIVPHGVFELTAIIMGVTCSTVLWLNLWRVMLRRIMLREAISDITTSLKLLALATLILVLAAFIEAFITPLFYVLFH